MADRLKWTETAISDLDHIASFISRDSPRYAANVIRKIHQVCEQLTTLPVTTGAVPEVNDPDVRQVHAFSYRVILRVRGDEIIVVAVFHGARDISQLLPARL